MQHSQFDMSFRIIFYKLQDFFLAWKCTESITFDAEKLISLAIPYHSCIAVMHFLTRLLHSIKYIIAVNFWHYINYVKVYLCKIRQLQIVYSISKSSAEIRMYSLCIFLLYWKKKRKIFKNLTIFLFVMQFRYCIFSFQFSSVLKSFIHVLFHATSSFANVPDELLCRTYCVFVSAASFHWITSVNI